MKEASAQGLITTIRCNLSASDQFTAQHSIIEISGICQQCRQQTVSRQSASASLTKISYTVDERDILKNVDFALHEREIVTLIGPNGAGKSTLIKVLFRHCQQPIQEKFIATKNSNFPMYRKNLTHRIASPCGCRIYLALENCDADIKQEIIRDTGITKLQDCKVQQLSGGERQRVLLARALLRQPDVLVLDEPMQGLDIQSEAELYDYVEACRSNMAVPC